ncbi:HAMP domain-containing protein [Herbidospora sp. NEAU-GS84]|uniref:histidine kinase n=1 Tax=Herbidospora solisilvae TaxID=2696284 RepID=A0A7C9MY04_9ACTN|nr:ATP-binding protein [Herbidospora solisilvae]NAS20710.1 HAMP domain-containing protein [Herbidospora solisilvae]
MSLPWLRTRSIRARLTLVAVAIALLILIPVGVGGNLITRRLVIDNIFEASQNVASQVSAEIRMGTVPSPIPIRDEIDYVQVVAPGGRVIESSNPARDLPPVTAVWPAPDNRIIRFTSCALPEKSCVYGVGIRATTDANSEVVYAAREAPTFLTTRSLALAIAVQVALLTALIGWLAWKITGRALRPVEDITNELAEITVRDLTRRVPVPPGDDEIARLARTANATLGRMQRAVEQQRQFAADASHELRTPIAGIRAQLESGRLHVEDMPEAIEAALRDTDRLEAICTDLLFLARVGSAEANVKERVDLAGLVGARLKPSSERMPRKLRLEPGVVVEAIEPQLARAFGELLDNADRHAASEVTVSLATEGCEAVLTVQNDGEGIAEADRERIFERFTRLDTARSRMRGGTGLGLAIAREVVEAHHGTVRVEPVPGGVSFVMRLPLAGPPPPDDR